MRETLTRERLLELLYFDETISRFRWKERPGQKAFNTRHAGKVAGCHWTCPNRTELFYRFVRVDKVLYREHHLVWLWRHGKFPEHDLDHKDGDGLNNHPDNLRLDNDGINRRNMAKSSANTSGHTGVLWCKRYQKWKVVGWLKGKLYFNGYFNHEDLDNAAVAAAELRAKLGYSPTHGLTREERKLPAN